MDRQHWETVKEIFHAALEVPESARDAFIRTASKGDPAVYSGVNSLFQADQEAGDFLEVALATSIRPELSQPALPPFQPGDTLCHRFRIIRPVGEGGMGYVFEAWDEELGARVALKAIRPEIANHPESLERFRREVRLALKITHPNVCRTFDIERETRVIDPATGATQEVFFLTMEFLEGETLAARLARAGPLALEDALAISRQAADALASAHELGIVHRDIKPANVMLVSPASGSPAIPLTIPDQLRAVITDFGLARQDPVLKTTDHSTVSRSGFPLGTLAYMAPEQLEGGQISPATDIYAFGLVLFEMVTGQRVFPSSNPLTGLTQRLTGPPPSPRSLVPGLPDAWCRAIEGCLRANPADRFQKTADVLAVLEGGSAMLLPVRGQQSVSRPATPRNFFFASWPLRLRLLAYSALFLFLVALFVGSVRLYLYKSATDFKVAPGTLVYLPPVKNETSQKAFDNITELIQAGLEQSVQINLLDQSRVGDTLQRMTKAPDTAIDAPIAREIAMRTGTLRVVFARVSGSAGKYQLDVDIQQPDNTPARYREHWKKSFVWQSAGGDGTSGAIPAELLTAVRNASDWIRHEGGESQSDIARLDVPPEDVTTSSWAALNAYAEAERLLAAGKKEESILAYREAIQSDPGFSLAYARMGDVMVSARRFAEGYRAYIDALNTDGGRRLSRKERDFIEGSYASDTCDYATALDAFRDYSAFYPNDFTGWFYQAYPLDMLDRPLEAIKVLQRAEDLASQTHAGAGGLVYSYMLLGEFPLARKWIEVERNAGQTDKALFLSGLDRFLEEDYPGSLQSFAELKGSASPHYRSDGIAGIARVDAEQGKYESAFAILDEGIRNPDATENEVDRGRRWLDRAYISCKVEKFGDCVTELLNGLSLDNSPDAILWASDVVGSFYDQMPTKTRLQAMKALLDMEKMIPPGDLGAVYAAARNRVHGEVLLARGDVDDAMRSFRKADLVDFPIDARDYLARGLLAKAAVEADASKARQFKGEALGIYEKFATRPMLIWRRVMEFPPGFAADEMERFVALARAMKVEGDDRSRVERLLDGLRPRPGEGKRLGT